MKIVATVLSVFLWLLGGLFVLAAMHPDAVAQHKVLPRLVVGGVLVLGGLVLAVLAWRPKGAGAQGGAGLGSAGGQEPPGQLTLKPIVCPHCGGQVDASSARLNPEGTLTVTCGYCKGSFMVQEEPKW